MPTEIVRYLVYFCKRTQRWNYKASYQGAHRRSKEGFDTEAEATLAAEAAECEDQEMLANWERDHPAPKKKSKGETVDAEKMQRGAKRRRCGGHGYSGGDGFKEIR